MPRARIFIGASVSAERWNRSIPQRDAAWQGAYRSSRVHTVPARRVLYSRVRAVPVRRALYRGARAVKRGARATFCADFSGSAPTSCPRRAAYSESYRLHAPRRAAYSKSYRLHAPRRGARFAARVRASAAELQDKSRKTKFAADARPCRLPAADGTRRGALYVPQPGLFAKPKRRATTGRPYNGICAQDAKNA